MDCDKCDYKHYPHNGGWCYMFRKKPEGKCMQHTDLPHWWKPESDTEAINCGMDCAKDVISALNVGEAQSQDSADRNREYWRKRGISSASLNPITGCLIL